LEDACLPAANTGLV